MSKFRSRRFEAWANSSRIIDSRSWHARLYYLWKAKAEFKTGDYRENLCHYLRVLIIWAPLTWLSFTRVARVPLVVFPLAALVWLDFHVFDAEEAVSWLLLAAVIVYGSIGLFDDLPSEIAERYTQRLWLPFQPLLEPIIAPSQALGRGIRKLSYSRAAHNPYVWVGLAAAVLTPGTILFPQAVLQALLVIAEIAGTMVALIVVVIVLFFGIGTLALTISDHRKAKYGDTPRPARLRRKQRASLIKLAVSAKTGKHCPAIVFSDQMA